MNLPDSLRENEFGFYEIKHKPTPDELHDYYARRYYQENLTTYQAATRPKSWSTLRANCACGTA